MAEIIKVYRQSFPNMRFVGRCYGEADKKNGTFSHIWEEWFQKGLFKPLALPEGDEPFEDANAFCGLCRVKEGEPYQYWIGVFLPPDSPVPEGYESVDMPAGDAAILWVYGREPEIYSHCCLERLKEEGYAWTADADGAKWCFERYAQPRFTEPDAQGNVILDQCFYIG